jgi:hypothetical protein
MKAFCLFVVYSFAFSTSHPAEPHVRPLDSVSAATYDEGVRRSGTFRALIDALQQSDLIVHVVTRRDLPSAIVGATRFVCDRGATRYVRVELSSALAPKARVSVLAHELQHAREIAGSGARSSVAVEAFYRVTGTRAPALVDGWESSDATAVERKVWLELGARAVAELPVQ